MPTHNETTSWPSSSDTGEASDPLARSTVGVETGITAAVVVAVDGSRPSGAALRVGAALAHRDGVGVHAVFLAGVAPPGGFSLSAAALRREDIPESTRLGSVRRQLCTILDTDTWNLHVQFGSFGPAVTNVARTTDASLIIVGLALSAARRWSHSGAVARVLKSAPVPVLAVPENVRALPHIGVVATDFSPASLRAARAARDLLARPGTLHLVHVQRTPSDSPGDIDGWSAVYGEGVSLQLDRIATELAVDGVRIAPQFASGSLTEMLFEITHDLKAELMACGVHHLNTVERLLGGETAFELLRRAECSVLVAPHS